MKAVYSSDQVQLERDFSSDPNTGRHAVIIAIYPNSDVRYISLVSSSFSIIQLLARITGRRNTRPRAKDGIR